MNLSHQNSKFLSHCCHQRHYFFEIKKCSESTRPICTPVYTPAEELVKIKMFPDPVPNDTGHYKSFSEVYGTATTEDHRPSKIEKQKKAPLHASVQNVTNSRIMHLWEEEVGLRQKKTEEEWSTKAQCRTRRTELFVWITDTRPQPGCLSIFMHSMPNVEWIGKIICWTIWHLDQSQMLPMHIASQDLAWNMANSSVLSVSSNIEGYYNTPTLCK